jgi:phage-related protein
VEARRIYRGRVLEIWYLAEGDRAYAREFVYGELTRDEQNQIIRLVQRMANEGEIRNVQQFRGLRGHANLYEFKRFQTRLMCFYDGPGRLVLTHGFKKKTDRTPPEEIERALRLREAYLRDKDARHDR